MSKTKISEFSTTPGNNTDINGINISEGCAPSGINDAIRTLMSDLKEWQSGAMDVYVIPQGTAAAPGIQLYGDPNTGIYGYGADQLGVAVNGAAAGYFSSAGWVGNVNGTITGDINATTIDTTNLEVTNIKAKDGTAAITIADSTGAVQVSSPSVISVNSTSDALRITQTGTGNALVVEDATNPDSTPTVVDQYGNIILGYTNRASPVTSKAEIHSTSSENQGLTPSLGIYNWSATASSAPNLSFRHYPSGTIGTLAANTSGDLLGRVAFLSYDGTNAYSASIRGVAGTGGTTPSITYDASGGHNFTNGPIDVETLEVTNIKARDGTASATIANSTGAIATSKDLTVNSLTLGRGLGGNIDNTAFGRSALAADVTGDFSVAIGSYALSKATQSISNTAVGALSQLNTLTGQANTTVGAFTLNVATTGSSNTALGYSALNAATGSNNTAVGSNAGELISSGEKNTIIGSYNGNQGGLDIRTASNYVVLSDGDGNPRAYWNGANATFGGSLTATTVTGTQLDIDNLRLDGNTISSTNTNGNITIAPNGSGQVQLSGDLDVANIETGAIKARDGTAGATIANSTGQFTFSENIKRGVLELGQPTGLNIAMIKATNTNGPIVLQTNGTGGIFNYTDEVVLVPSGATAKLSTENGTNFNLDTDQETGAFTVGGASQTGAQTFGQSTKTHTLNVGSGATENGLTKTVNIATGGVSGSTTAITIGSTNGTTTTLNGTVTAATFNSTTIDTTNIEVTNIKAKDGTASIALADSTGAVTISPAITANGGAVFNESGADVDFRVEGDTDANLLFADASTDRVGVGTNAPSGKLSVTTSTMTNQIIADSMSDSTTYGLVSLNASRLSTGYLGIAGGGGTDKTLFLNVPTGGKYSFRNNFSEQMQLDSSGGLIVKPAATGHAVFNEDGVDADFRVEGDTDTHLIFADASADKVGIGTNAPAAKLDVYDTGNTILRISGSSGGGGDVSQLDFFRIGSNVTSSIKAIRDGSNSSGALTFYTATSGTNTERMRLDSSGNLGIGTNAPGVKLDVVGVGRFSTRTNAPAFYGTTTGVTEYMDSLGTTGMYVTGAGASPTNSIRFFSVGNLLSTLDSAGNLGLGVTPVAYGASNRVFQIDGGANASEMRLTNNTTGTSATNGGLLQMSGNDLYIWNVENSFLSFGTNNTERARITSGGYFKASNTGTYGSSTSEVHELVTNKTDDLVVDLRNSAASPYGARINFTAASPDNNTNYFLNCSDNTTTRCYIYSDGDLANHDGVYGTISDQKLKQDIVDAGSQWDDIKAIRFRKYRMKTDVAANPDAPALLGVIAQELEQVSPGLVDEHPDYEEVEVTDEDGNVTKERQPTGTTTKTVKSSILLMKAAVALQEAMTRIETLEAEVAALKGA